MFLQEQEERGAPPPSIRDVSHALGYSSPNSALKLIRQLRDADEVIYEPGLARSLRLARKRESRVPLLGSIAAGLPDPLNDAQPEYLPLDPTAFGIGNPSDAFALRVRGDSMIERQFFEGDLVLLDRSALPKDQDVVAALIDQESTLKTLVVKNGKAWLKAENPAFPDLIPVHDLQIQGVAKAVIRILSA